MLSGETAFCRNLFSGMLFSALPHINNFEYYVRNHVEINVLGPENVRRNLYIDYFSL